MDIRTLQTKIRDFLKMPVPSPAPDDPPYIHQLARSEELTLAREIAHWWRAYQIEQFCPLTATWLQLQDQLDEKVTRFYENTNVSAFIEQASADFLDFLPADADSITRSIARFEKALIEVRRGEKKEYEIEWNMNPYMVLDALLERRKPDLETGQGRYVTAVSSQNPEFFNVYKIENRQTRSLRKRP